MSTEEMVSRKTIGGNSQVAPHAKAPNVKWLTDITKFQIPAGKVYLSPIIDCFDGMVISW